MSKMNVLCKNLSSGICGEPRLGSACVSTVWSRPSYSANRIISYDKMYEWRAKIGWYFAPAQDDLNFVHFQKHFFAWRYVNNVDWDVKPQPNNFYYISIRFSKVLHQCQIYASVSQLDARPTCDRQLQVWPLPGWQHSLVETCYEIFSIVILSLLLILEGQLSVSGERMCTIMVYLSED